jgi:hypothetical protein
VWEERQQEQLHTHVLTACEGAPPPPFRLCSRPFPDFAGAAPEYGAALSSSAAPDAQRAQYGATRLYLADELRTSRAARKAMIETSHRRPSSVAHRQECQVLR